MKRSFMSYVFSIALLVSLFLSSACAAVTTPTGPVMETITAINFTDTVKGMMQAARGGPGTFLLSKDNLLMMAWPYKGNYGFVILEMNGKAAIEQLSTVIGNGNKAIPETMADLAKTLGAAGWKYLLPEELPVAVFETLRASTLEVLLTSVRGLTSIFIVPAGIFEQMPGQKVKS